TGKVEGLEVSIDTVLIATGEDFINLRSGIYFSGLSNDGKYLFNSGGTSPYLERINLETLKFEERMNFDEDGPNAFGDYVFGVSSDVNNNLVLTSGDGTSIFNLEKQKLKKFIFNGREFQGDKLEGREQFISKIIPSHDYKTVYGLVENYETGEIFFAIVNEENQSLKKVKLDGFERAHEYTVEHSVGGGVSTSSPQSSEIVRLGNKLIITNPVFSKIAVYDLAEKNLKYYDCNPTLTASGKVGTYTKEVNSRESFEMEILKIKEEVTFLPLMIDLNNEHYVRLSIIGEPKMNDKGLPEMNDHKVFISILNDSFEVTKEAEVADGIGKLFSTPIPQKPFMKDGKVWLYLNVNDELAFVRLDLDA
ncbi:MAG: DUF4221 family protein, partial [Cyclobacterium sp.]